MIYISQRNLQTTRLKYRNKKSSEGIILFVDLVYVYNNSLRYNLLIIKQGDSLLFIYYNAVNCKTIVLCGTFYIKPKKYLKFV